MQGLERLPRQRNMLKVLGYKFSLSENKISIVTSKIWFIEEEKFWILVLVEGYSFLICYANP